MRVLWFTNSSSNYGGRKNAYNGGGWISSLENEMKKREDIELAISFVMAGEPEKTEIDGVTYYPIQFRPYSLKNKILCRFRTNDFDYEKEEWNKFTDPMLKVIDDFKPDIIEIFGSELPFSLVVQKVSIPAVLHVQGLILPYWNAYFPGGCGLARYCLQDLVPHRVYNRYMELVGFKRSAWREKEELSRVSNYIGRTEWSRRVIHVFNPEARFFYGGEILREVFYEEPNRTIPGRLTIVSTISQPLYKGFDLILKTAKLLRQQYELDFVWKVFGNINPRLAEKLTGIRHNEVNVRLEGVVGAGRLKRELENATVYAHTAYIENSPNSVCEAQIVGVPVIATNVGGVNSLVTEGETGFLVPSNDPYQMSYLIKQVYDDKKVGMEVGDKARAVALERHDKKKIVRELVQTYKEIIVQKQTQRQ